MPQTSHRIIAWMLNLLAPGTGLVLAGSIAAGVAVAVVWGLAVAGALVGLLWPLLVSHGVAWVLGAVGAGLYLGSQVALYRRLGRFGRFQADTGRDDRFKAALVAYLQGRYEEADAACRALLRQDPDDVEAMLQLGSIARRRGRLADARRCFLRARYLDDVGRWDAEIGRELASMTLMGGRSPAGRAASQAR
jgi:tetratricopeptide (TPR) repeat protein